MNMYQAINNGLRIAMTKDPNAGNEIISKIFFSTKQSIKDKKILFVKYL